MAAKIIAKSWAEQIDQANVPNCVNNLRDALHGPDLGPEQRLPLPVAVGHDRRSATTARRSPRTSIAEPTKIADLWTIPADKVTFLTEARDTFGLGLLKLGIDRTRRR